MTVTVVVNGRPLDAGAAPDTTVLELVRSHGLTGAKSACGRGECGACTVLVGGVPRVGCITLVAQVDTEVTTVEGLGELGERLGERFADHGAFQCAYCTPGHVVTAAALVTSHRRARRVPDREELRRSLNGNLCRCTGYSQILDAVTDAILTELGRSGSQPEDSPSGGERVEP